MLGTTGVSDEMELSHQYQHSFAMGSKDDFFLEMGQDLGDLTEIDVRMEPEGLFSNWKLERILVLNIATNHEWEFKCGEWFDSYNTSKNLKVTVSYFVWFYLKNYYFIYFFYYINC